NGHLNHWAPKGQVTWEAKNIEINVGGDVTFSVGKTHTVQAGSTMSIEAGPKMTWKAPKIQLNPAGATAGSVGGISVGAGTAQERTDSEAVEWVDYTAAAAAAAAAVDIAPADPPPEPPPAVVSAAWGQSELTLGQGDATLSAQVANIDDGASASFEIKDRDGRTLATVNGSVSGGAVAAQWTPELPEGSPPELVFEVTVEGKTSKSGVLKLVTWVDVTITDPDGQTLSGAEYELVLDDGSRVSGMVDSEGHARHERVYPGDVKVVRVSWGPSGVPTAAVAPLGGSAAAAVGGGPEVAGPGTGAPDEAEEHYVAEKLLDSDGEPLIEFPIALIASDGAVAGRATTDEDGGFAIKVDAPGKYTVRVEEPDLLIETFPVSPSTASPCGDHAGEDV
ncbi:MAG TPA: carboxypeptidase-like regulatory domain-containing protein, partial [Myxococcota bacterium]|nr:carboxypeptidase-like regulatory domain-containing protein [Myxococcota bacterium]